MTLTPPRTAAVPPQPRRSRHRDRAVGASPVDSRAMPRFAGLDGLRALAIAAVMVFHLNPSWLPGGFLGVDVFFVISGFLITSLLVHEISSTGSLDARRFWTRRARRLLPALLVVVVASSLLARLVSSDLVVALWRQVLGAATFSTNWVEIAAGQSYFDRTAPALFMNFWSLAVEEQFYLVWPLIAFLLIRNLLPSTRVWVPLGAAAASTLAMGVLFTPGEDATRVYYGTDTHLAGLMIGASLAFAWASPYRATLEHLRVRFGRYLSPVAGVVLLGSMLLLSEGSSATFRGGLTLACLATAVLLVAALDRADTPTAFQRVLDLAPLRWVGERSYGIYLWHWPVILIVSELIPTAVGTGGFVATGVLIVVLTLVIAEASYSYLEQPVRRLGFRASGRAVGDWLLRQSLRTRRVIAGVAVAVIAAFVVTVATAPASSLTAVQLQANAEAAASQAASGKITEGVLPLGDEAKAKGFAMPTGAEIDGFGDSMMVGGVHALKYYFPGVRIDAKSNTRWRDGLRSVRMRGADTRRAVILDFGTNAGMDEETMRRTIVALGPDRMIVITNEYGRFSRISSDNETLRRVAAGHDNVIVADWQGMVRAHPDALQADGIHPSLRGSHYYAQAIEAAFAELSQQHTGQAVPLVKRPMP